MCDLVQFTKTICTNNSVGPRRPQTLAHVRKFLEYSREKEPIVKIKIHDLQQRNYFYDINGTYLDIQFPDVVRCHTIHVSKLLFHPLVYVKRCEVENKNFNYRIVKKFAQHNKNNLKLQLNDFMFSVHIFLHTPEKEEMTSKHAVSSVRHLTLTTTWNCMTRYLPFCTVLKF